MFPDLMKFSDPDKLRNLMSNALRLGHADYAFECQMRIAELAGQPFSGLEREFWTAVSYGEETKRLETGKAARLTQTRQKQKRLGAVQCLTDMALAPAVTDGFEALVQHGKAEFTGEAVVVRNAEQFPAEAVASAAKKLEAHGITREQIA
jgi:hypothetical protein